MSSLANQNVCDSIPTPWEPVCEDGTVDIIEGGNNDDYTTTPSTHEETRLPTSDIFTQWNRNTGSDNFALLLSSDDDTTYTYTNVGTAKDYFGFDAFTLPVVGSVTATLTTYGRFRRMAAGGSYLIRLIIKVNGSTYYGSAQQVQIGRAHV